MAFSPRMEFLVNALGIRSFFQEFTIFHYHPDDKELGDHYAIGLSLKEDPYLVEGKTKVMSWALELLFSLNTENRLTTSIFITHWHGDEKKDTEVIAFNCGNFDKTAKAFKKIAVEQIGLTEARANQYVINEVRRMCELSDMVIKSPIYDLFPMT